MLISHSLNSTGEMLQLWKDLNPWAFGLVLLSQIVAIIKQSVCLKPDFALLMYLMCPPFTVSLHMVKISIVLYFRQGI